MAEYKLHRRLCYLPRVRKVCPWAMTLDKSGPLCARFDIVLGTAAKYVGSNARLCKRCAECENVHGEYISLDDETAGIMQALAPDVREVS